MASNRLLGTPPSPTTLSPDGGPLARPPAPRSASSPRSTRPSVRSTRPTRGPCQSVLPTPRIDRRLALTAARRGFQLAESTEAWADHTASTERVAVQAHVALSTWRDRHPAVGIRRRPYAASSVTTDVATRKRKSTVATARRVLSRSRSPVALGMSVTTVGPSARGSSRPSVRPQGGAVSRSPGHSRNQKGGLTAPGEGASARDAHQTRSPHESARGASRS